MNDIYTINQPPQKPQTDQPPLLLMLHGFGSNEHDLIGLSPYLDARLHIVSARACYDIGFGYAWYYLYGVPGNLQHDNASRAQSLEMLTAFIEDIPNRFEVDPKQIYLLGFSQGAVMSLNVALKSPHLVAGVVAISGYLDEMIVDDVQTDQLANSHFLVMHGTMDDLIPVKGGREIKKFLKNTSANLEYHEYPTGHSIHPNALEVMGAWFTHRIDSRNARQQSVNETT